MSKNFTSILLIGISTVISGILSYLYHPLMVRYLDITTFGEFESMVSIFNVLGVLTTGFALFLTKEIAGHKEDMGYNNALWKHTNTGLIMLGIAVYVIFLACSPFLARYLHIDHILPFALVGITIVFAFASTFPSAAVQGLGAFKILAANTVINSLIKLLLGLCFVLLGRGIYGAIGGFIVSSIAGFLLLSRYVRRKIGDQTSHLTQQEIKTHFLSHKTLIIHFFIVVVLLSLRMNIDVIIVKNIFHAQGDVVGIYAGISIVAKFVIFLGTAIETVYYPRIMETSVEKTPSHLLRNAAILITSMGIVALLGTWFLGGRVLHLFKPGFEIHLSRFMMLVCFCRFFCYSSMFAKILVARGDKGALWILGVGLGLCICSIYILGSTSIESFIYCLVICSAIISGALVWRTWYVHAHKVSLITTN